MNPPNGLLEIVATFGDINQYIHSDGTIAYEWEREQIDLALLPFALKLSWDHTKLVSKIRCHRLLVPVFEAVFNELQQEGLEDSVQFYGGCYMYRPERASTKLSTHSWGIAIDLNPETNQMGDNGDLDPRVVAVFEGAGFSWGGKFTHKRQDPMHFQFATGY